MGAMRGMSRLSALVEGRRQLPVQRFRYDVPVYQAEG